MKDDERRKDKDITKGAEQEDVAPEGDRGAVVANRRKEKQATQEKTARVSKTETHKDPRSKHAPRQMDSYEEVTDQKQ
jgi:hypothetical protein